jgi:hypothetical protein
VDTFAVPALAVPNKGGKERIQMTFQPLPDRLVSTGGLYTMSVVTTSAQVVKAGSGRLCKVIVVTANGSNAIEIYDNASAASGTVIGYVPASAAAGSIYDFQMPANAGIYIPAVTSGATITVSFE